MNPLRYLNRRQLKKHALIWAIIIIYFNIIDSLPGPLAVKIIGSAVINLNYMFVFYSFSLFIFPKFWVSKRFYLVLNIIGCLIVFWIIMYFVFFILNPGLGGYKYTDDYPIRTFLGYEMSFFTIVGAAGASFFFNRYGQYKLKQQAEKENLLLIKELNFLKNQFNSHITFNFLNFCYSRIHKHSPETAESIELFSELLRYTLQIGTEEKVALSKEISYIENFIKLQKLLSVKVYANFDYEGNFGNVYILPRILITFVENAFKHGVFNDSKHPIRIDLKIDNGKLIFTTKNLVSRNKRIESSNKGMENVTQILDLYYANNYALKKEEEEGFYSVELRMGVGETVGNK
jgi:hypothetical protein